MRSFAILRTNVGLTTNVKVMVDSSYNLSLDAIDSTPELSVTKLKKMGFNKKNYFDELVPYFFKGFPTDTAFAIKYENDSESMSDNFASQYDEIYQYGARNIISNKDYSEEFEYFAPLHITKGKLPKSFIIFRVDGTGMINLNKLNIKDEIFNNFKTVKLFDLSKSTNLGEWIDMNFISNSYFPNASVEINFENLEFSQWNGIDYDSGGYTTKSLFLDDFLGEEKEIFEMEKFVLDGFRMNKVIYPNIINFSFLFDDTPADSNSLRKWSINRYYGFYLDSMDLISTISPYRTPFLKGDVTIDKGNILKSVSGDPFIEGWSDDMPFYVEYGGNHFKVEKFMERELKKSVAKIVDKNTNRVETKSKSKESPIPMKVSIEPIKENKITSGTVIKEEVQYSYVAKWRIISDLNIAGKQKMLNKNIGYIRESDNALVNYDNTDFEISDFELADLWIIEIDGMYHNLIKEEGSIKIYSDYSFKFYENEYEYWINKSDPKYTKRVSFIVDNNNIPKKFKIYRLKLTDIKDFDDRIVDTEYSKFEYEKESEITNTEETKLYMTNLNSTTHPKELDDFHYKGKVVHIPVSSEYTANHETFKIYDNDTLTSLWRKNSVHCRWAFEDSLSANDYPYLLNNSIRFEDYNRSVNPFDPDPHRIERNLDYFYTINSSTFSYLHHTLHVENNNEYGTTKFSFDFEKYLGTDTYYIGTQSYSYSFDYFSYFFDRKSTFSSNNIRKNTKKYSLFSAGDESIPNITLFRGMKFSIHDIDGIKRNSNKQIESINIKNSNTFDEYKFSILLTGSNNGMVWDVIDEWKMDRDYKVSDIVIYNDILYIARRNVRTTDPIVYRNSTNIKALPYNLPADWSIYTNNNVPLYNPLNGKNKYYIKDSEDFLKSVVYNSGDYYLFNGYDKAIDFWNPLFTYTTNSRLSKSTNGRITFNGYSKGNMVLYRGDYYQCLVDNNIYAPNYTQEFFDGVNWVRYWVKIEPLDESMCRWRAINIWNPGKTYVPNTYIIHNEILYISNRRATNISSGEEPGISDLWDRLYSFLQDTNFKYQPSKNPFIRMNNEYYRIISNPWGRTLENGINIYINKKWKHVFINISINDNTLTGLRDKDRDDLYIALNKKLTAMNFIEAINNLSIKRDFTDYINYIVISEDGKRNTYNFDNIEKLPYILTVSKPEDVVIKANSLDINKIGIDIKPKKILADGNINNIREINYYNNTHIATSIDSNLNTPFFQKNYHGGENILTDTMYRFSGNYTPLFYDIELFKKDNAIKYNEMQIALNLEKTQDLIFTFTKDKESVQRTYTIYSGASYSYIANTIFTVKKSPVERNPILYRYDDNTGLPILLMTATFSDMSSVLAQYNSAPAIAVKTNNVWSSGAVEGDRYLVGPNSIGDWSGTYSSIGTSSIFYKKNSIATLLRGFLHPTTKELLPLSSTNSIPYWSTLYPITTTWSYWNPSLNDVIFVKNIETNFRFDGLNWVNHIVSSGNTFKNISNFVGENFYNQIKNAILDESLFKGIEFIFETHNRNSQYVADDISNEYGRYDNNQTNLGLIRNFNILSVKYKSTYGDLKLEISQVPPTIMVDFIDFTSVGTDLELTIGATGLNPPFQWSFGYTASSNYNSSLFSTQSFSTNNHYILPDVSGTNLVFDIKVIDSIGLSSSVGVYSVNSGNTVPFKGTFSYTTL
jgi:hypothetical protein